MIYDRFLFNSSSQEAGEGISHFVTDLRHLASTCEFRDKQDELIRYRIVLGIRDNKVRAKILREKKLILESAQEILHTSEATASQGITNVVEQTVHAFHTESTTSRKPSQFKQQEGHSKKKTKASVPRASGNKGPAVECGHCARKHGSYRKVHSPAYGKTCSRCGKQRGIRTWWESLCWYLLKQVKIKGSYASFLQRKLLLMTNG